MSKIVELDSTNPADYGVTIERAETSAEFGHKAFRLIKFGHLSQQENSRNHHVFVRVYGLDGSRYTPDTVSIDVNDSLLYPLNKLSTEIERGHGDVPMWPEDTLTVEIYNRGGYPSDRVVGLHPRHPEQPPGNTLYHHSFYLEFQLMRGEPDGGLDDGGADLGDITARIRGWVADGQALLDELNQALREVEPHAP